MPQNQTVQKTIKSLAKAKARKPRTSNKADYRSHGNDHEAISHQRIAQRAYDIWQAEECPDGRKIAHWHEAEAQLRDKR